MYRLQYMQVQAERKYDNITVGRKINPQETYRYENQDIHAIFNSCALKGSEKRLEIFFAAQAIGGAV